MIYKEITLAAAMQMVLEGNTKDLFVDNAGGLAPVKEFRFYLSHLHTNKWFKRIPKETELKKE